MRTRKPKNLIIQCTKCPSQANLADPRSCYGWQIVPFYVCRTCIDRDLAERLHRAATVAAAPMLVVEKSTFMGKTISTFSVNGVK